MTINDWLGNPDPQYHLLVSSTVFDGDSFPASVRIEEFLSMLDEFLKDG